WTAWIWPTLPSGCRCPASSGRRTATRIRYSRLASARTTCRPRKPDPPKTVTRVSRFDAMAPIPRVKFVSKVGYLTVSRYANMPALYSVFEHDPEKWAPVFRKDHAPATKSGHYLPI